MKNILLQIKFIIVANLNFTYTFIPLFIRRYYLRIYNIKIGKKSYIHRGVKFFHVGNLTIGNNSVVNFSCFLDNRRGIYIGNNVGIAHNTKIYTLGHNLNSPNFETKGAPVYIEDNAFIFSNCIIMPGIVIGEGSIILPGSIVTKSTDPYTINGGNPSKFIKFREKNITYKHNYGYLFAL